MSGSMLAPLAAAPVVAALTRVVVVPDWMLWTKTSELWVLSLGTRVSALLVKAMKRPSALRALSWELAFNWLPDAVVLARETESSTRLSRGSSRARPAAASSRDDLRGLAIDISSCPVSRIHSARSGQGRPYP